MQNTLELPFTIVVPPLLAAAAAFTGLEMAERVSAARGWGRPMWGAGGAAAMGVGIWSTQYVGLLASQWPVPVWYDWPTVIASLFAAILGSTAAMFAFSRKRWAVGQGVISSVIIGGGIAAAHYAGRAAMRLVAMPRLDPGRHSMSVVLDILLSLAAIWLWFRVSNRSGTRAFYAKSACAIVLGATYPIAHYLGTATTRYIPSGQLPDVSHAVDGSVLGAIAVSIVTGTVFGLAILTSIYDRRLSDHRAALRSAERRYRDQFQRSPAGMMRVSRDGRILDCNLSAARMFGFDAPVDFMATPMLERYVDVRERESLVRRLITEKSVTDLELCLQRKDGSPVSLLSTVSVVEDQDGTLVFDATMIDVTDKNQLEIEILHTRKLEAVGKLAAGIAHEINTPIQFVADNAEFLGSSFAQCAAMIASYERVYAVAEQGSAGRDVLEKARAVRERADWEYLQSEVPRALEQMRDGLARVAKIVSAMKDFSHVDRAATQSAADINHSLESTLLVARSEYQYVARIETEFAELPPVICDIGDLNQVFLNLIVNAAHAVADAVAQTQTMGCISIRTRCAGEYVEVDVSDTGSGIPESIRDRIFDPFFTTKAVGRGSGQGLAVARSIVHKHGGTLTFDSDEGRGTTFHLRLPIHGDHAATASRAA